LTYVKIRMGARQDRGVVDRSVPASEPLGWDQGYMQETLQAITRLRGAWARQGGRQAVVPGDPAAWAPLRAEEVLWWVASWSKHGRTG
jgi:hypothetical protein